MTGSVCGSEPSPRGALPEKGDGGRRSLRGAHFLPDAPFPDASHGIFGKTQSLWDEATVGKLKQGLRGEVSQSTVGTVAVAQSVSLQAFFPV